MLEIKINTLRGVNERAKGLKRTRSMPCGVSGATRRFNWYWIERHGLAVPSVKASVS